MAKTPKQAAAKKAADKAVVVPPPTTKTPADQAKESQDIADAQANLAKAEAAPKGGRVFPASEANVAGEHGPPGGVSPAEAEKAQEAEDADQSVIAQLTRLGIGRNEDHVGGHRWVGPSYLLEDDKHQLKKIRTSFTPLAHIGPRTGDLICPTGLDGECFSVGDGFGPSSGPDEWAKVVNAEGQTLLELAK